MHSGKSEVMIMQGDQFVGPLLPVKWRDIQIDYTTKTKLVGVVIDNKLTWRDQLEKTQESLSSQYRVLKKMRYLSPKLLETFYFRTVIPQVTYCISVWGNCSVAKLYENESLHIKVGRFIHRVPQNVLESEVQAPVVGKPISANPRLNRPNPRLKFNPRLVSVPESAISTIPGLK